MGVVVSASFGREAADPLDDPRQVLVGARKLAHHMFGVHGIVGLCHVDAAG